MCYILEMLLNALSTTRGRQIIIIIIIDLFFFLKFFLWYLYMISWQQEQI